MTSHIVNSISSNVTFGDSRLNIRFGKILSGLSMVVENSIPETFKAWGQAKAVYRFLTNKKVTQDKILSAQLIEWTNNKLASEPVILAIHDTTELDFTGNRSHDLIGCLDHENRRGLYLHNTLFCDAEGTPQVVFNQHYWNRDKATLGGNKARKHTPIKEKESHRWIEGVKKVRDFFKTKLNTTVINICDREGDIYELLSMARGDNSHYLVRSCNNRRLKDQDNKLWDQLNQSQVQGTYQLDVNDKQILEKRTATLQVKWLENIELLVPYRKGVNSLEPIQVNMILVEEVDVAEGITPINWKLLTSLPITSLQNAFLIIKYYSYRWRIETFHYILKQGCKVEDLQLEQEHNLKNAVSLYSIIACRLLSIMYLSRKEKEVDIMEIGFTKAQYKFLYTYLENAYKFKISQSTKDNLTIKNLIDLIAKLGGHLKHNGNPGIKVLWKGMNEFNSLITSLEVIKQIRYG